MATLNPHPIVNPVYDPTKPVTIQIPGIQDIISIPALEDKRARYERAMRLKARNDPLPEALRWIPSVINTLDDAQDYLATALYLGMPLWRRLPSRLIPYLGTILLANDALNLINLLLGLPLTGTGDKADVLKFLTNQPWKRLGRIERTNQFLTSGFRALPFALQAGQVLQSATGYGIKLGPIMAAFTDTVWGTIRAAQGGSLQIQGPPETDILSKGARVMSQVGSVPFWGHHLTDAERIMIELAATDATARLVASTKTGDKWLAIKEHLDSKVVTWIPWNPATQQALEDALIPIDDFTTHPRVDPSKPETYRDAIENSLAMDDADIRDIMDRISRTQAPAIIADNQRDRADILWDLYNGEDGSVKMFHEPRERIISMAIEHNYIPWPLGDRGNQGVLNSAGQGYTVDHIAWITVDIFFETGIVPQWRFQNAYHPEGGSIVFAIENWVNLSLQLWCGEPIWMPTYDLDYPDPEIKGWRRNAYRWGTLSPYIASILLWGNCSIHLPFRQVIHQKHDYIPPICSQHIPVPPNPNPGDPPDFPYTKYQLYFANITYVERPSPDIPYSKQIRPEDPAQPTPGTN